MIPSQSLAMKNDILKQYVSARSALLREKAQLEGRLERLNQALGQALDQASPAVAVVPKPPTRTVRRVKRGISMKTAVLEVTKGNPMTKPEIMAAIQKLGFRSASEKPMRMLDNLLYGKNPRFKKDNGKFSPLTRTVRKAGTKLVAKASKPTKKRKMSAAAKAALSLVAKARWAKIKAAGGRKLKAG